MQRDSVVVIGGGIVGSAVARELARGGREVTVLEAGPLEGRGWMAAAGLLAPQIEAHVDDPLLEVGLAGREYWDEHRAALETAMGGSLGLVRSGILHLAADDAEAHRFREQVARQRQQGLVCDWLLPTEVAERWPWLPESHGALWAPRDGAIDPVRAVEALVADGARQGVRRVADQAAGLEVAGGRVAAVRGTERHPATTVVIAAGAWSGRLAGLPRPISVEPVRGQMLAVARPAGLEDVIVYGEGHYLLTRGGEVLVGATMEHAGFAATTTPEAMAEIRAAADTLCPPIREAPVTRAWAGLRPVTPDGLPIVGPEPRLPGLWYATGHGRNGVLLAGVTGVILAQMMAGEATVESAHAFRPERFWNW